MSPHTHPKFTWLGHACVRFDLPDGGVAVIDPFIEGNPSYPAKAPAFDRLDLILVTHAHGDHMGSVIPLAKRHGSTVVATYDLCQWLASQGVERVSGMNLGGTQELLGLRVTQVRADHTSGFMHEGRLQYGGVATGFVVRLSSGFTFYHAGDTALFSDMQLIGDFYRPELGFLPIGDHFTMDPHQAARACRFLNLRRVIPIHWGTFPVLTGHPDQLRKALSEQGAACEVIALAPGESY